MYRITFDCIVILLAKGKNKEIVDRIICQRREPLRYWFVPLLQAISACGVEAGVVQSNMKNVHAFSATHTESKVLSGPGGELHLSTPQDSRLFLCTRSLNPL